MTAAISRRSSSCQLPKRPISAQNRYLQALALEANQQHKDKVRLADVVEKWKTLGEEDKRPFVDEFNKERKLYAEAMRAYRKSLDSQGISHRTLKKFTVKRMKQVLELNSGLHQKRAIHKETNPALFYTLRTAVALFLQDLGKQVQEHLETRLEDVISVDVVDKVVEKKFGFVKESHLYQPMLESLVDPRGKPSAVSQAEQKK